MEDKWEAPTLIRLEKNMKLLSSWYILKPVVVLGIESIIIIIILFIL